MAHPGTPWHPEAPYGTVTLTAKYWGYASTRNGNHPPDCGSTWDLPKLGKLQAPPEFAVAPGTHQYCTRLLRIRDMPAQGTGMAPHIMMALGTHQHQGWMQPCGGTGDVPAQRMGTTGSGAAPQAVVALGTGTAHSSAPLTRWPRSCQRPSPHSSERGPRAPPAAPTRSSSSPPGS